MKTNTKETQESDETNVKVNEIILRKPKKKKKKKFRGHRRRNFVTFTACKEVNTINNGKLVLIMTSSTPLPPYN